MIDFFKNTFLKIRSKLFKSLRMGMLFAILFSLFLAVICAFLTNTIFKNWIENKYSSEESRKERYLDYVEDLQSFVNKNGLSSNDTAEILSWVSDNRNIYLFIYKNDVLFFDSSLMQPGGPGAEDKTDSPEDEEEKEDSTGSSSGAENGTQEGDKKPGAEGNENTSAGSGLTVQYPTREEIIASAKNNGQLPLEMSDGSLLVSIADFTEYIYYDAANILTIVVGVVVLTLFLMLYFQNILTKISGLAKDVTKVYEVDMNTPIRTSKGDNELAQLTRNVEQMRSSMMESLEKEKEAISANTELITSMSHDIRTPLTVLLGYLDIMKESTDDANMQEYLKASEITAMRLKNLSDDMFRYFLVFGGKGIEADLVVYNAKTLIEQLLSEHILLLKERGYSVVFESGLRDDDTLVSTDAPKIMLVVDNVFSNIYKYADVNFDIVVKTTIEDKYLSVCVLNKISETRDEAESNGVGLKTCKRLCEAISARFEYTEVSECGGEFSVRIELPIANEAESNSDET